MCLLVIARHVHPRFPLVVAANRDEVFAREAAPLATWDAAALAAGLGAAGVESGAPGGPSTAGSGPGGATTTGVGSTGPERVGPSAPDASGYDPAPLLTTSDHVTAGRDLSAGGTWLAVATGGRFSAVTNVREPGAPAAPLSRGQLPLRALAGAVPSSLSDYGPVNLLAGGADELWYATNRGESAGEPRLVPAGVSSLSNATLDTPWPKSRAAAAGVAAAMRDWDGPDAGRGADAEADESGQAGRGGGPGPLARTPSWAEPLLAPLLARGRAPVPELPRTGLPLPFEWFLSAPFVRMPGYGTRCQTAVAVDEHGAVHVVERRFDQRGRLLGVVGGSVGGGR